MEVPPYPSIEEPAGTSLLNPILITAEEDSGEVQFDDDADEELWILRSPDDHGQDPSYDPSLSFDEDQSDEEILNEESFEEDLGEEDLSEEE